jgi:hypothetical protein
MNEQFVIAAGGSGVRSAEALVHLCAAGLGPDHLHLLVVDVDDTNGNLSRLRSTLNLYKDCSKWKWRKGTRQGEHFRTKIEAGFLTAELPIGKGGILDIAFTPPEYRDVLDLLYDNSEQRTDACRGFQARPNIGSLLMAGYLSSALAEADSDAGKFRAAISNALADETDSQGPGLTVVGSVFGGTGASVIPIAVEAVRSGLARRGGNLDAAQRRVGRLRASAVMMLPYFQPEEPPSNVNIEETVDPGRFLTDTRNALSHYERSEAYKSYRAIYLVGAVDPRQAKLQFCTGSDGQSNRPMIEELVAALAILDSERSADGAGTEVRAFRPSSREKLAFQNLPWPGQAKGMNEFADLLHMAAFAIKSDKYTDLGKGVIAFLDVHAANEEELTLWPWQERFGIQTGDTVYKSDKSGADRIGKYFYRLLEWSQRAFRCARDVDMLELRTEGSCFHYWEAATIGAMEDGISNPAQDKVPVHASLLLAAAAALPRLTEGKRISRKRLLSSKPSPEDWLIDGRGPEKVRLPFGEDDFEASRQILGLSASREYDKTGREV